MEVLKRFSKLKLIRITPFFLLLLVVCCKKETSTNNESRIKKITLNKLFEESTYRDSTKVFTNDSIFCIYTNSNHIKVWKNGKIELRNHDVKKMIEANSINKTLQVYKYQSEFMKMDFKNYLVFQKHYDLTTKWDFKDYRIDKKGENYFLSMEGYNELKLPISKGHDMDWITFNSMDINNDKIPELFIFHEYYNSKTDEEFGDTYVYEIKK